MSKDNAKRRSGLLGLLMALGVLITPFLLGLVGVKQHNQEDRELEASIAAGHERRDLPVRNVILFLIGLLVMLGVVFLVTTGTMTVFAGHFLPLQYPPQGLSNAPTPPAPAQPQLETVPGVGYNQLKSQQEQKLNSYGWVDQKAGVVHIPIDRAMQLLLQRGLPTRPQSSGQFQDEGQGSPSVPSSGRMMEPFP